MNKCLIFVLFALLAGCDKLPIRTEPYLIRAEIYELCGDVGVKAFAEANNGKEAIENLHRIERGAAAECKLKYLTDK